MDEWLIQLGISLGVLIAAWLALVLVLWLHRPSRELVGPFARLLADVALLLKRLITDPATPRVTRWVLIGAAAWILSPLDLVPEFVPLIGPLDDLLIAAVALRWAVRRVGLAQLRALWPGTEESFALFQRLLGRAGGVSGGTS